MDKTKKDALELLLLAVVAPAALDALAQYLTSSPWGHLLGPVVGSIAVALRAWLKQSPLPVPWDGEDRRSPTPPAPQPPETPQP